jgi:hypothetical protein
MNGSLLNFPWPLVDTGKTSGRKPGEANPMYDEELAATGLGSLTIGGIVFDSMLVALIGFMLVAAGLLLTRLGREKG